MKKLLTTLLITLPMMVAAQFSSAPAFPGAEGYGRYVTGGRGGTIYHVTSLADYCDNKDYSSSYTTETAIPGTLRYAVKQSGARIIVFDVAGTITLKAPLKITNGDLTILGQTAPGGGICLRDQNVTIQASNIIIRYLRFRMGDEGNRYYKNGSALAEEDQSVEDDALNSYHGSGSEVSGIIIDHCSMSWSTDECGSFYGNRNFTLQWCILSESLRNSVHEKGTHGYGGIWGGEKASFHHNLLADHDSRNPRFDHGFVSTLSGPVDYTNNVVYNWGSNSTYGGENKPGYAAKEFNIINNYYKPGPYTKNVSYIPNRLLNPTTQCSNCNSTDKTDVVPGKFYISGNKVNGSTATISTTNITFDSNYSLSQFQSNCVLSSQSKSSESQFNYNTISVQSADKAYEVVANYAGASHSRDAIDDHVVSDMRKGVATYTGSKGSTNGLIDTQSDVGGWPTLTGTAPTDTDGDGIPDEWEDNYGLNKYDASDASTYTLDVQGYYMNIEVYANSLVEADIKAGRSDATETFTEYYPVLNDAASPTITTDLASLYNISDDESLTLSIVAEHAYSYQWYKDGAAISGATSSSYTYTPASTGSAQFYCIATNSNATGTKTAQSTVATVTVSNVPTITWVFDSGAAGQTATMESDVAAMVKSTRVVLGSDLSYNGTQEMKSGGASLSPQEYSTKIQQDIVSSTESETLAMKFLIKPKTGVTFTPKSVSFRATRCGTDGGKMTIQWYDANTTEPVALGTTSASKEGEGFTDPARENNTTQNWTDYSYDLAAKGAVATTGECGLKIILYNASGTKDNAVNPKSYAYGNIVISGTFSGSNTETLTLGQNGYSTFAGEHNFTVSGDGVTACTANYTGSKVRLTTIDSDAVIAQGAGIVLRGAQEGDEVTITFTDEVADISSTGLEGVTSSTTTIASNPYIIASNGTQTAFVKAGAYGTVAALMHKAYLNGTTNNLQVIPLAFEEATDIGGIKENDNYLSHREGRGKSFTLDGRRLHGVPHKHGAYISDGKVIIK